MDRPYVICHMLTSVDGKVTGNFLRKAEAAPATSLYYDINRSYQADAFACGRVTMEESFTGGWLPNLSGFAGATLAREDYIANKNAGFFAVAFDRCGRLGWKTPQIVDDDPGYGKAHIIEVLCEKAPAAYLAYLRSIGISYIFAGQEELDLSLALGKLKSLFNINRLLLEGGSILNGAFQRANAVDELSLVMVPTTAEAEDKPLFYRGQLGQYSLKQVKTYSNSALWLNYQRKEESAL
ncbi:MAG: dihydrofolate reductase family protein [Oscillospiraceae bacterium]